MTDSVTAWIQERRADDAKLIPAARAQVAVKFLPAALSAIEAVLELHVKGYETVGVCWCRECELRWPCATVQTIESALEAGE